MMDRIKGTTTALWTIGGGGSLLIVTILDYFTGSEISFSLFYVIPIIILVWVTNEKTGVAISIISAITWLMIERLSGAQYSSPFIYAWNTIVRLAFFLITVLLVKYGKDLELERLYSRVDFLTGAINGRFFYELAQMEMDRSDRFGHPLTIVYFDVDDFKSINDKYGHSVGDKVLTAIVSCVKMHLRKTDIVARVGGDEFAILLPQLNSTGIRTVLPKLQKALINEMQRLNWNITFSFGALTFNTPPSSVNEMLNLVDQVMYSVKNKGKNNIKFVASSNNETLKEEDAYEYPAKN